MTNLFFISSSGSMATKWMSKVISASPKIKCFHGSFGLQKLYNANLDMASALSLLGQWSIQNNTQFVGITHLSMNHGTVGVKTCESMGVPFCGLARDPILATDSQYQERVQSESLPRIKLVRYWEMAKSIEGMEQLLDEAEQSDVVFFRCAESVISHLFGIEASDCEVFKFEDYTTSYDAIQKIVHTITKGIIKDDYHINIAYSNTGKINSHRAEAIETEKTWQSSWSDVQRKIFVKLWRHYSLNYTRNRIFYPIVDDLVAANP